MPFTLQCSDSFFGDLMRAPRKVQTSFRTTANPRLVDTPTEGDGAIKKLKGWKGLWRYRIGDYRLVYHVEEKKKTVSALMLRDRKRVYDDLGHVPERGPDTRIIADERLEGLLEEVPSERERAEAMVAPDDTASKGSPSGDPAELLPEPLSLENLEAWGVKKEYHAALTAVRTVAELELRPRRNREFVLLGFGESKESFDLRWAAPSAPYRGHA